MYFGQSISGWIRGLLLIMFILGLVGISSSWYPYSVLSPAAVVPGAEIWRIVSYPLAHAFGGLLISFVVFSMPGEELEAMFGRQEFGRLILISTITFGLVHSLVFFGMERPLMASLTNTSLFIYALYLYLYPASRVRVIFFSMRSTILGALLLGAAMAIAAFEVAGGAHPGRFLSAGLYGAIGGALYAQIRFQKFELGLGLIRRFTRSREKGGDLSILPGRRDEREPARRRDSDRLDEILEKISAEGVDSLSREEREFLREYSGRM